MYNVLHHKLTFICPWLFAAIRVLPMPLQLTALTNTPGSGDWAASSLGWRDLLKHNTSQGRELLGGRATCWLGLPPSLCVYITILGLLVDPTNMSLYLPVARRSFQYRAVTRSVRDFEKAMDMLDIIFAYMRQFEAEIPLSPHDVQGSTLRLITGRISATEARLDQVSAQLEEVTARLERVTRQLEELKNERPPQVM